MTLGMQGYLMSLMRAQCLWDIFLSSRWSLHYSMHFDPYNVYLYAKRATSICVQREGC